jgi:hypothetical protein
MNHLILLWLWLWLLLWLLLLAWLRSELGIAVRRQLGEEMVEERVGKLGTWLPWLVHAGEQRIQGIRGHA